MSELAFVVIVIAAVLVAASGIFTAARRIPEDEDCGCEPDMGEMMDRIYKEDS